MSLMAGELVIYVQAGQAGVSNLDKYFVTL